MKSSIVYLTRMVDIAEVPSIWSRDPLLDDVTYVNKTENGPYLGGDLTHELLTRMVDIAEVPSIWSRDPLFDDVTYVKQNPSLTLEARISKGIRPMHPCSTREALRHLLYPIT